MYLRIGIPLHMITSFPNGSKLLGVRYLNESCWASADPDQTNIYKIAVGNDLARALVLDTLAPGTLVPSTTRRG